MNGPAARTADLTMSTSPLVDDRYRLTASDLAGRPRRLQIANVTSQGLEDLVPVLHFDGMTKRLVLAPDQTRQVIAITGSTLFADWIGHTLVLVPRRSRDEAQIAILPPDGSLRGHAMPPPRSDDQRGWRLAWLVVGVIALASFIYIVLNSAQFDAYFAPFLP